MTRRTANTEGHKKINVINDFRFDSHMATASGQDLAQSTVGDGSDREENGATHWQLNREDQLTEFKNK